MEHHATSPQAIATHADDRHVAAAVHQEAPVAADERAAAYGRLRGVLHAQQEARDLLARTQKRAAEVEPELGAAQQDRLVHGQGGRGDLHTQNGRVTQERVELGSARAVEDAQPRRRRGGPDPRAGGLEGRIGGVPGFVRRAGVELERLGALADLQAGELLGKRAVWLVTQRRQLEARAQVPGIRT